jgi:hypothetical protein
MYDAKLSKLTQSLYKYAALFHLGFGFIMFSNKEILQNDSYFDDKGLKDLMTGTIPFADRITSGPSLIMFIAFFIMLFPCILLAIHPCFFLCEIPEERSKKGLLELVSFKQLMKEYNETKKELQVAETERTKLAVKLKEKLDVLSNAFKYYFAKHKVEVNELTKRVLNRFYREHKEALDKSGMEGLISYRLTVSINLICIVQSKVQKV